MNKVIILRSDGTTITLSREEFIEQGESRFIKVGELNQIPTYKLKDPNKSPPKLTIVK